jgi:hypothetical protein
MGRPGRCSLPIGPTIQAQYDHAAEIGGGYHGVAVVMAKGWGHAEIIKATVP